jgi:hypothetical protein
MSYEINLYNSCRKVLNLYNMVKSHQESVKIFKIIPKQRLNLFFKNTLLKTIGLVFFRKQLNKSIGWVGFTLIFTL